ncbi:FHA domain-containing protein [Dokdonella sp.]|uniref:FHA domain-containing protein n=1 Tax=Dokdonella sp. TaxID=2291710 RepID=UPI00262D8356|nr:FHA domain-containing protein [Dokdonella sp.]
MQVWSTRKPTHDDAAKASAKGGGQSVADAWALRVLAGIHAGAERKLQERTFLMIGSSDDCDLIFSDHGVAAHHCIVTRNGDELSIRAVDAEVRLDDQVLHPGDPQDVKPFTLVRIGGTCFALGPHWSDRWQTLLSQVEAAPRPAAADATPPRQRGNRVVTLAVALVLLGASAGALMLAQNKAKPVAAPAPAAPRDGEVRGMIDALGYHGLAVTSRNDGRLVVTGYVERSEDLATLRSQLEQHGIRADVEAKSGARIAEDLAERFRMKNLHAKTEWQGQGKVLVRGRFGDRSELDAVLVSRTIQEFNEKLQLKIDLQNLDPPPPEPGPVPDGKRIREIVDGSDPYLKTADKSVLYVGAKLPSGGTFMGIENGEVLVRDDAGNIRRLSRESVLGAPSP